MLRIVIFFIGCGLLIGALVAARNDDPQWFSFALAGLVFAGGVLIERWRYKPAPESGSGQPWQATGERFVDMETNKVVEVYFDPSTGERSYVDTDRLAPP